ncbi:MAG: hypothetical protein WEB00_00475 [Dehalococcoidia bacterium]
MSIYTILSDIDSALAPQQGAALAAARAAATELGYELYLVGGTLRDVLLGRPAIDLDLVTEGPAAALAEVVAAKTGGQMKIYGRFATTSVTLDKTRVDIARARTESYAQPGALPDVHPAPLDADLARRDFTINAIAYGLTGTNAGELIDPTGGVPDLDGRLIRVIHRDSFVDDATRILRGLRFASRLDFEIEPQTAGMMRELAPYLRRISPARLRTELRFLLDDDNPWRSLEAADELGVLAALVPGLSWSEAQSRQARAGASLPPALRAERLLALLASSLAPGQASEFIARFGLGGRERRMAEQAAELGRLATAETAPAEIAGRLRRFEDSVVNAVIPLRLPEDVAKRVIRLRALRPQLNGRDLMELGLPEGPLVGEVLEQLRQAVTAGSVRSRDDELALARQWISEMTAPKS